MEKYHHHKISYSLIYIFPNMCIFNRCRRDCTRTWKKKSKADFTLHFCFIIEKTRIQEAVILILLSVDSRLQP